MIKITQGNDVTLRIPLERVKSENGAWGREPFVLADSDTVAVQLVGGVRRYTVTPSIGLSDLTVKLSGVGLGTYGIEIRITRADGQQLRSKRVGVIQFVDTDGEAELPQDVEFGIVTETLDASVLVDFKSGGGLSDVTQEAIDTAVSKHNASAAAHSDIRKLIADIPAGAKADIVDGVVSIGDKSITPITQIIGGQENAGVYIKFETPANGVSDIRVGVQDGYKVLSTDEAEQIDTNRQSIDTINGTIGTLTSALDAFNGEVV